MFKDKLIELRKQNNDTQESLAKKINVSRSLVAKWEQNRAYPTNEDLDNIAKVYNVTYEELMSDKELKKIYGIVSKNSKKKNILIMILSIIFSLSTIILVIINLVPNTKYIHMENNEVNVELKKYNGTIDNVKFESNLVGETDKNNFMKNDNFYTWEWFQMYRYKLTKNSSIYYFHYMIDITPGFVAYYNSHLEYNNTSLLDEVSIIISLTQDEVYPIYSWPNKKGESVTYESTFSSDNIFESVSTKHGVSLNKKGDKITVSYDSGEYLLGIIMDPSYSEQWVKFDYSYRHYFTKWDYKMKNKISKERTLSIHQFYMFEVNESKTNEFSFKVDKKILTDSNKGKLETNHITTYNCDITKIKESI